MVILLVHGLVSSNDLLDKLCFRIFFPHLDAELLKLCVKSVFVILAVKGLQGVVIKSICSELFSNSELALHLFDAVLFVVDLDCLQIELEKNVVEHNFLQNAVRWNLQHLNLSLSESIVAEHSLLEWYESATSILVCLC